MARLIAEPPKFGMDNPLSRVMLTKDKIVVINGAPHTLIGICRNRIECMVREIGVGHKAFKLPKSKVVEAITLMDIATATNEVQKASEQQSIRRALLKIGRHRLLPRPARMQTTR